MSDPGNQRLRRARPVLALAAVAFAIGAIVGAQRSGSPRDELARSFVSSWIAGDYAAMYADLDIGSQREISASEFAAAYERASRTATASGSRLAGRPYDAAGGVVAVPVRVRTRLFGTLSLSFELHVLDAASEGARVQWTQSIAFPGLVAGERLQARTALPPRATLLARDGSVLAEGDVPAGAGEGARSSPLGSLGSAVVGQVGPAPASRRGQLEAEGVPPQASVGVSGLEEALEDRLRGTPGGELLAVGGGSQRVLASAQARSAGAVRTSVSPAVQRAAVTALGSQLGGIVAMVPASGQILAVAGIGLDGLQPPGSTFKMITLAGVLAAHLASPRHVFPYASYATLDGVRLNNANGENCGGSLELAFAVSCNSVFAPLGAKLGAGRLVATAEAFGFNGPPGVTGAAESTLPAASSIQGELATGSTAIGQGQVLATPLQMATVAAAIADGGRRPTPTFALGSAAAPGSRATSADVARTVRRLMIGVVREGTGTAAAIPGVTVAGKTGTAELKTQCQSLSSSSSATSEASSREGSREGCSSGESEAANTDAWFAAFAPALHPRVAVCVLLVKDGAGGATAAPVAREVLEAALAATR